MKRTIKLCLLSSLFVSMPGMAGTVSLEYAGFHDRLKVVNKGEFPRVELTFSVPQTQGCKIISGEITTESKRFPLTFTQDQRLYIPFDNDLKTMRALVNLETQGDAAGCGLALQIRERVPKGAYTVSELTALKQEMDDLQAALQGFPMKYFAKSADGIRFLFDAAETAVSRNGIESVVSGEFILGSDEIDATETLKFSQAAAVVSPWFNRGQ
ncbi:DUF2987 domain-containing protein [Shewanella sp.]|uniref:DUF2987 domain-containing protein n=1 Tax=Shewanella sp. TaxID=50422 RepID=UPI00356867C1